MNPPRLGKLTFGTLRMTYKRYFSCTVWVDIADYPNFEKKNMNLTHCGTI